MNAAGLHGEHRRDASSQRTSVDNARNYVRGTCHRSRAIRPVSSGRTASRPPTSPKCWESPAPPSTDISPMVWRSPRDSSYPSRPVVVIVGVQPLTRREAMKPGSD
jgi:hypothetical protein